MYILWIIKGKSLYENDFIKFRNSRKWRKVKTMANKSKIQGDSNCKYYNHHSHMPHQFKMREFTLKLHAVLSNTTKHSFKE